MVTSQLEHTEFIFIKIPGFFWRNPSFFTPRGFRKSPQRVFLLFFSRVGLKIWLQVNYGILNSYPSWSQGFSWVSPLFTPQTSQIFRSQGFCWRSPLFLTPGIEYQMFLKLMAEHWVTSHLQCAEFRSNEIFLRIPLFQPQERKITPKGFFTFLQ